MLIFLFLPFAIIFFIMLFRTFSVKPRKGIYPGAFIPVWDLESAAQNLSRAVRLETIRGNDEEFRKFLVFLQKTYPNVNQNLEREILNDFSVFYRWRGKNSNKKPILFTAHIDVARVEKKGEWTFPPFSGKQENGYIWGRGTLDAKVNVIALMEALEKLLAEKFIPQQDIYFAFGHDEETRGGKGAKAIAQRFEELGLKFAFILDEGGFVNKKGLLGVKKPVALVGTCEKGSVDVFLEYKFQRGSFATPPRETALGKICGAISRLEKKQFPGRISPPIKDMFQFLAPEMNFFRRYIISNLWLFRNFLIRFLIRTPGGNALLRTTTAPAKVESHPPDSLPTFVRARLNFRPLPGDTVEDILDHIKKVINDQDIRVTLGKAFEPTAITNPNSLGFKTIEGCIKKIFPHSVVVPTLIFGETDARRYQTLSDEIIRFTPVQLGYKEARGMHGINERISEDNLGKAMNFYFCLIQNN